MWKDYGLPILLSVLLHLSVVGAIGWGWQKAPNPNAVVVPHFVEAKLIEVKAKAKPAKVEKNKVIDLTAKRKQQEKLKREAEKKRQAMVAAKREKDRKVAEAKKRKAEELAVAERLAKQDADRKQKEQQRLQRETAVTEALIEEQAMLAQEESEAVVQSYVSEMTARIEQQWSYPASTTRDLRCLLQIQLVPTGEVISVAVVESSGNAAFDRSAVQAVKKVGRFDDLKSIEPHLFERYFRQFRFKFNPTDSWR